MIAVDGTTIFTLVLVFSPAVLMFLLYQYKAHNRTWVIQCLRTAAAFGLLLGYSMGVAQLDLPVAFVLSLALTVFLSVAWHATARLPGRLLRFFRISVTALALGPILAIPKSAWTWVIGWSTFPEEKALPSFIITYLWTHPLSSIPAFVLVSLAADCIARHGRDDPAPPRPRWAQLALRGIWMALLLTCTVWLAAGLPDVHRSCRSGNYALTAFVLRVRPGSVNWRERVGSHGNSLLECAASNGHVQLVHLLLQYGADPKQSVVISLASEKGGGTLLHWGAAMGDLYAIREALDAGIPVSSRDGFSSYGPGETPLHFATIAGRSKMALLLIADGAQVDVHNGSGLRPLHYAVVRGDSELALHLLEHGASIGQESDFVSPMVAALQHPDVLEILLKEGGDPNERDGYGFLLHRAVDSPAKKKSVEMLISAGAMVNSLDSRGMTPLDVAVAPDVREVLLKHCAKSARQLGTNEGTK